MDEKSQANKEKNEEKKEEKGKKGNKDFVYCHNYKKINYDNVYYEDDFGYKKETYSTLEDLNNKMFLYLENFVLEENNTQFLKMTLLLGFFVVFIGVAGVNSCQAKEIMRSRISSPGSANSSEWLKPVIELPRGVKRGIKARPRGVKRRLGGFRIGDFVENINSNMLIKVLEGQKGKNFLIPISIEKVFPPLFLPHFPPYFFQFIDLKPQKVAPTLDLMMVKRKFPVFPVFVERNIILVSSDKIKLFTKPVSWLSRFGEIFLSSAISFYLGRKYPFFIVPVTSGIPVTPGTEFLFDRRPSKIDRLLNLVPHWLFPKGSRNLLLVINEGLKTAEQVTRSRSQPVEPPAPAPSGGIVRAIASLPVPALQVLGNVAPAIVVPGTFLLVFLALFRRKLFDETINKLLVTSGLVVRKKTLFQKVSSVIVVNKVSIAGITVIIGVILYSNRKILFAAMPKQAEAITLAFHQISSMFSDYGNLARINLESAQKFSAETYKYILSSHAKEEHLCRMQGMDLDNARTDIRKGDYKMIDIIRISDGNSFQGKQCHKDLAVSQTDFSAITELYRMEVQKTQFWEERYYTLLGHRFSYPSSASDQSILGGIPVPPGPIPPLSGSIPPLSGPLPVVPGSVSIPPVSIPPVPPIPPLSGALSFDKEKTYQENYDRAKRDYPIEAIALAMEKEPVSLKVQFILDEAKNAMKQAPTIEEPQVQEPTQIPDNSKRPIIQKVKNIFKGKKGKSGDGKSGDRKSGDGKLGDGKLGDGKLGDGKLGEKDEKRK